MTSPVLLNKAPPLLPGAMTAEVEITSVSQCCARRRESRWT